MKLNISAFHLITCNATPNHKNKLVWKQVVQKPVLARIDLVIYNAECVINNDLLSFYLV